MTDMQRDEASVRQEEIIVAMMVMYLTSMERQENRDKDTNGMCLFEKDNNIIKKQSNLNTEALKDTLKESQEKHLEYYALMFHGILIHKE